MRKLFKNLGQVLRSAANLIRLRYEMLLPESTRWGITQRRYQEWADSPIDEKYLDYVVERGKEFSCFVGNYKRLVDAGCGNGYIGGKTYAEIGYSPLKPVGYVLGIDPLPMKVKPPWVTEYRQARVEDCAELILEGGFDKAIIVTSLDHFENPLQALKALTPCRELCLWGTTYKLEATPDLYHIHRFTFPQLRHLLVEAGWMLLETVKVDENDCSRGWFIRAQV